MKAAARGREDNNIGARRFIALLCYFYGDVEHGQRAFRHMGASRRP